MSKALITQCIKPLAKAAIVMVVVLKIFTVTSLAQGEHDMNMRITRYADQAKTAGATSYFTGDVLIATPFQADEPARVGGATVAFKAGARTAWHTHPLGQTLIITEGMGWIQEWGKQVQEMHVGDVVWIAPGVKHWHGATDQSAMTHMAVAESLNGSAVEWLELVSEAEYARP